MTDKPVSPKPQFSPTAQPSADVRMLPFGIPQLDELFGYHRLMADGDQLPPYAHCLTTRTSLSIVGPDGTGKSVFALHLAATYAAIASDLVKNCSRGGNKWILEMLRRRAPKDSTPCVALPRIVYVSSDLQFDAASRVWQNFCLRYPWDRYVPFLSREDLTFRRNLYNLPRTRQTRVKLVHYVPHSSATELRRMAAASARPFPTYLTRRQSEPVMFPSVAFLDLAGSTAGDDWLYVNRLLSMAERPAGAPPNLMILDSVAGFEALVGERNSFGEEMSRRARIAQLVRTAGEDWHVVFAVEEPHSGEHHPEEYVTDAVLHLRRHGKADKMRRTLEIEKCRAQAFGAGEHPFEIRNGRGASTGNWEHPDDPHAVRRRYVVPKAGKVERPGAGVAPHNAYVQVFPSLSFLSQSHGEASQLNRVDGSPSKLPPLGFGIPGLDELLHRPDNDESQDSARCGLPTGSVTSLSGEEGTRKARLAEQFLEEAFREFPATLKALMYFAQGWKVRNSVGVAETLMPEVEKAKGASTAETEARVAETNHAWVESVWLDNGAPQKPDGEEPNGLKALVKRWKDACSNCETLDLSTGAQKRIVERIYTCARLATQPGRPILELLPVQEGHFRWRVGNSDQLADKWKDLERPLLRRWDAEHYYVENESAAPVADYERCFLLALSLMRVSWGVLTPAIYVSTSDATAEQIVTRIVERHQKDIVAALASIADPDHLAAGDGAGREARFSEVTQFFRDRGCLAVQRLLERFFVVRRIELSDASAPQLWHIISRNVTHGLNMLGFYGDRISAMEKPVVHAETIRVLVSDLRLVRETYPQVREDPLFLATLVFRLRRLGVTSLIVDSDSGRPGRGETNPFSAALRSLTDHQIYTWNVPFFGEQRVAISVIPPISRGPNGVIRELRFRNPGLESPSASNRLLVDPHFELYSGLEDGKPVAVPLQVLLYKETPAIEQYVNADLSLFSRLFTPVAGGSVMKLLTTREYIGIKDLCQLPTYTRLDHTLVFMIDDYWASAPNGSLRSQDAYLNSLIESGDPREASALEAHAETTDVFELFRDTAADRDRENAVSAEKRRMRKEFFAQRAPNAAGGAGEATLLYAPRLRGCETDSTGATGSAPASSQKNASQPVDRVPFLWDFGFLVCNPEHWDDAKALELEVWNSNRKAHPRVEDPRTEHLTVGKVWEDLTKIDLDGKTEAKPVVGWREFLEAAGEVAAFAERVDGERAMPLDISMGKPESIACLIMEIWFSEIRKDLVRVEQLIEKLEGVEAALQEWHRGWLVHARDWVEKTRRQLKDLSSQTVSSDLPKLQDLLWMPDSATPAAESQPNAQAGDQSNAPEVPFEHTICTKCPKLEAGQGACKGSLESVTQAADVKRLEDKRRTGTDFTDGDAKQLADLKPKLEDWRNLSCEWRELKTIIWPLGLAADAGGGAQEPASGPEAKVETRPKANDKRDSVSYPIQFYKAWLLLLDVLDFNRYLDDEHPFEIKFDYQAQSDAVAVRHWYKTASTPILPAAGDAAAVAHARQHGRIPVRLPGYYAMRGDWHLAVARGSRSDKLADRALDILSSRRANRARLHMGVGLPTRDISSGASLRDTRTLLRASRKGSRR